MPDDRIEKRLRFLSVIASLAAAGLMLFVVLCVSVLVYLSISVNSSANEVKDLAENNNATLCTFRASIQERRDAAAEYLENHPKGIVSPVTGAVIISAIELQRNIDSQTLTLEALDKHLDCQEELHDLATP